MKRRAVDIQRDYDQLLSMQRVNWGINFPRREGAMGRGTPQHCSAAERGAVYIYEQQGTLIGWLWLDFSRPGAGHIRHLQVAKPHWGKGIGRRVMEDAIDLCADRECGTVTLTVTKSNVRAMALYEHLGFVMVEDLGERQRMALDLSEAR